MFSKIDNKLECYDKNLFLFGTGSASLKIKNKLEFYGKKVFAYVDNNESKQGITIDGVEVLSLDELLIHIKGKNDYTIQIASSYSEEIEKQLLDRKVPENRIITYWEFCDRIEYLEKYLIFKEKQDLNHYYFEDRMKLWEIVRKEHISKNLRQMELYNKPCIFINSAPKTGNTSISKTFENYGVPFIRGGHGYSKKHEGMEKVKDKKIKMISGVREPFSQFLSIVFEWQFTYFDLEEYWNLGGNVQNIFDRLCETEIEKKKVNKESFFHKWKNDMKQTYFVCDYFDREIKEQFGIDVFETPFDKEKGYSVLKNGEVEILIYQLEKISELDNVFGEFLDIKDFKLLKANEASQKWYYPYYKKAKQEVVIDRELVKRIYSGKFMKHFYTDEQIAQFFSTWEKNLK